MLVSHDRATAVPSTCSCDNRALPSIHQSREKHGPESQMFMVEAPRRHNLSVLCVYRVRASVQYTLNVCIHPTQGQLADAALSTLRLCRDLNASGVLDKAKTSLAISLQHDSCRCKGSLQCHNSTLGPAHERVVFLARIMVQTKTCLTTRP